MSTYYRPERRRPRHLASSIALAVLPLFIWAGILHVGHSLWTKSELPPWTVEQHLPGCSATSGNWSLQWTAWDGWYCHNDLSK